jgi:predicted PurR-regulated permease PerM
VDIATVFIAIAAVAVVAYTVTVVHAATIRMLGARDAANSPEARLLAWPKWLSALVAGVLLAWLLYRVRSILLPFVLGAAIAYVLNPGIDRLETRGWSRPRAIWLVFGVFVLLFVGGGLLVVPTAASEARRLLSNQGVFAERGRRLADEAQEAAEHWGGRVGVLPGEIRTWLSKVGEKARSYGTLLLEAGLSWLRASVGIVSLLVITPVVAFWFLRDYHSLSRRLLRTLPPERREAVVAVSRDINRVAGGYLLGMATMVFVVSVYGVVVLSAADIRFSVLLGIMLGVLSSIPYLGFPAAIGIIVLTMLVTQVATATILVVVALLIFGNLLSDYIVAPRVIGQRVGLHPLVVIFALLAGGALLGFIGMVLAVPFAGSIKVLLLHFWPEVFGPELTETAPT